MYAAFHADSEYVSKSSHHEWSSMQFFEKTVLTGTKLVPFGTVF